MSQKSNRHFVTATYTVQSQNLAAAATAIARGQSVGNPTRHSVYETEAFLDKYAARARTWSNGTVQVSWPKRVLARSSVSHLLSVVLGGQCDMDLIQGCRLTDLDLTAIADRFPGPRFGLPRIRDFLGVHDRPLVGGIVKPKIGLTPTQMTDVCVAMADGGVDFIKEDEILSDPAWCRFRDRVPLIAKRLEPYHVLYAPCITEDGGRVVSRARHAREMGATAVHCNLWAGLGVYAQLRQQVALPIFFQKSGDRVWTTGAYSLDYAVLCDLVHRIGCDFAHVGMYGGYLAETVGDLRRRMAALGTTCPSFSCGMTPEAAAKIKALFGNDLMVTSGGWIHEAGHAVTQRVRHLREAVSA